MKKCITENLGISEERREEIREYTSKKMTDVTIGKSALDDVLKGLPDYAKTTGELIWMSYVMGRHVSEFFNNPMLQMMGRMAKQLNEEANKMDKLADDLLDDEVL